ncbi:MAG: hypothetical protein ACR2IK_12690 [Chloroflexota bacterium]
MTAPRVPQTSWQVMAARGYGDLSPPEAELSMLELPTNRAEYVGVLQDIGGYPARSPIGQRVPGEDEIAALTRAAGGWRAIVLLDDERALRTTAGLFSRVFVLDPLYDSGALLYAAWHDLSIRGEHSRRLAQQAGLLVRAGSLLNAGTAILAPDHLPGSWNPRPDWRTLRPSADSRELAAWAIRTSLVLLYWADRLDGVVCTTRSDIIAGLDVALGPRATASSLELAEPASLDDAQTAREAVLAELRTGWTGMRRLNRRRARQRLPDVASALSCLSQMLSPGTDHHCWRLASGDQTLPEPALLIARALNGQDPDREPRLPRKRIKRRPLCLLPASG